MSPDMCLSLLISRFLADKISILFLFFCFLTYKTIVLFLYSRFLTLCFCFIAHKTCILVLFFLIPTLIFCPMIYKIFNAIDITCFRINNACILHNNHTRAYFPTGILCHLFLNNCLFLF